MRITSRLALFPFLAVLLAWSFPAGAAPVRAASFHDRYPRPRARFISPPTVRARLLVTPKNAEVYVDGYYAGLVNNFDGLFQGLRLRPGLHTIVVYLPAYRTVHEHLTVTEGAAYTLRYTMRRLEPGAVSAPPPTAPTPRPVTAEPSTDAGPPPPSPPGAPPAAPVSTAAVSGFGAISIRTQPANAQIWIDGSRWPRSAGPDGLVIRLADGLHRVEIRCDGYRSFSFEVRVRQGATTPLNVSLPLLNK